MLRFKMGATAVFLAIVLLMMPASAVLGQVAPVAEPVADGINGLFLAVDDRPHKPVFMDAAVEQVRYVTVNWPLLRGGPQQLRLNLFADEGITAVFDRLEQNLSGSTSWIGHVAGKEQSSVILVSRDGVLQGRVVYPGATYRIKYVQGTLHQIARLNEAAYVDHDEEVPEVAPQVRFRRALTAVASDDGSVIDVMVVYTAAMRAANGGTAAVEAQIDLAVSEANLAYQNSTVGQQIHLVHIAELAYSESGNSSTDLSRLRSNGDGFMDEVHSLRNTYHADFVLLATDGAGCGLGYLQSGSPDPSFQSSAFAQARDDCLTGNYTLPHEFGHNMGLRHDWYVDHSVTPAAHAHGYAHVAGSWRTVMSYNDLCVANGGSCTRSPYFSNPTVSYNGSPTGVAVGTASNCVAGSLSPNPESCDAYNAVILNTGRVTNSQFRSSQITWLGNSNDWYDTSNWVMYEGPLTGQTAVNRLPRAIDNVLIPASPSGGNFPAISSGTAAVRDLTIATGASLTMSGGTLTVYGNWEEQGTGTFNGSGGSVTFVSTFYGGQTVTSNATTTFPNVQIGDGGSSTTHLGSNVDINGNLTIASEAILNANSYTINLAGNWTENNFNGFDQSTSHVIFDGINQTVSKTIVTQTISTEDFDPEGSGNCANNLPSGWSQANNGAGFGWATGQYANCFNRGPNTGPYAVRWWDTPDVWIFTTGFEFSPGIEYGLSFKYANDNGSTSYFDAYLASSATIADMLSGTNIVNGVSSTAATYQTATGSFTVPSAGTYYIGVRGYRVSGSNYGFIDDVAVSGSKGQTFYNVTFANHTITSFTNDVAFGGNLVVNSGATADFGSNDTTVEGSVTNNGTMQQSRNISDGSGATTYEFLMLENAAGSSTKYYGVTITPDGGQALGQTAVSVSGNQNCTSNSGDPVLRRCYNITPTNAQSATIKYWYTNAELNGQTWNDLKLWDWHSNAWTELAAGNDSYGAGCGTNAGCWGQWTGVATFSPMVLGSTTAPAGSPAGPCSAPTAPTTLNLSSAGTALTWSGGTADSYQVWRATNLPYFTPGSNCASPGGLTCSANATSPFGTSSGTVGTNYYYKVVAVNSCGSSQTAVSHVGQFSFGITPGLP